MNTQENITSIYEELTARYDRISVSTIKNVLKGKQKVKAIIRDISSDKSSSPELEEAESAFRNYTCAIYTAFRGGYTLGQNLERNARLKVDMEEQNIYYRPVKGCYKEAGMEYPDVEYCFFTFNKDNEPASVFFEKAYRLSEKYDQDSFLYKRGGINNAAFLIATNDNARGYLHGDIYFTGQYFSNVEDVIAWTDCKDGRFAFLRKGMIITPTGHKKIKLGEGDIFDIEGYKPDGIIVLRKESLKDIADACNSFDGSVPLVQHVFSKDRYTPEYIHEVIFRCLKKLRDQKCKRIGFHCSVAVDGSTTNGAAIAYNTIRLWAKRYDKKFDCIIIVDMYGDYSKVIDN